VGLAVAGDGGNVAGVAEMRCKAGAAAFQRGAFVPSGMVERCCAGELAIGGKPEASAEVALANGSDTAR
jgi:hypothetical protein